MVEIIIDDEWVNILEDTPQKDKRYRNLSVEVIVLLDNEETAIGFYDESEKQWYYFKDKFSIRKTDKVVAWKSK